MSLKKVDVLMGNVRITLRSDESPEYLQKLASYVDQKIADLKAKNLSASVDERRRSLFIAMNLADDYFKLKDRHTAQDVEHKELINEKAGLQATVADLQKENATLADQLTRLKADYEHVQKLLDDFDNRKPKQSDEIIEILHDEEKIIPLAAQKKRKVAN